MTSTFAELGVATSLVSVLTDRGITEPTPIQAATLPDSLAGRDVLGRGRTGSGKTLAFAVPLVARLSAPTESAARTASRRGASPRRTPGRPRGLVLAPTRELATQIDDALTPLARAAGLTTLTVFGGVGQQPQVRGLAAGVDIVIACPGRLADLIDQGACSLAAVEITVLDEADHMADMGFLPGVRRLLRQTPAGGQRLLFSATLDKAIDVLVREFLRAPVTHEADSATSPVATMSHHVLQLDREQRLPVLVDLTAGPDRTVVFTRTKYGAKALARQLTARGVPAVDLHGNLSQNARTRNMAAFHSGQASTLVATDIAARGIHVDDVALVVHADPPTEHKAYLHRSGRTARAGASGTVVTLATADQRREVRDLARAAGIRPTVTDIDGPDHPILRELNPGERLSVDIKPGNERSAGSGRSDSGTRAGGARKVASDTARPTGGRRRGGASSESDQAGGVSGGRSGRSRRGRSGTEAQGAEAPRPRRTEQAAAPAPRRGHRRAGRPAQPVRASQ